MLEKKDYKNRLASFWRESLERPQGIMYTEPFCTMKTQNVEWRLQNIIKSHSGDRRKPCASWNFYHEQRIRAQNTVQSHSTEYNCLLKPSVSIVIFFKQNDGWLPQSTITDSSTLPTQRDWGLQDAWRQTQSSLQRHYDRNGFTLLQILDQNLHRPACVLCFRQHGG